MVLRSPLLYVGPLVVMNSSLYAYVLGRAPEVRRIVRDGVSYIIIVDC